MNGIEVCWDRTGAAGPPSYSQHFTVTLGRCSSTGDQTMGLFKRISDIVSANLNDMVESWEEPEKMLKQAVREMETAIDQARRSVAKAMASEKLVGKELLENERHAEQWQTRAESAVAAGDDTLALKALARKREHESVAAALRDQQ